MKTLLVSAAFAAAILAPSAASAQSIPASVIAVVDVNRVSNECNACKTAVASLRSQAEAEQNREKALVTPLETEQQSIRAAISALNGKQPDAALQARMKAFQTKYQQAQDEANRGQEQLQRNAAYVNQQIQQKLNTVYTPVMQRRGANLLLDLAATVASTPAVDVTNDVLAALNAALPSISTTAPVKQQPQGR